MFLVITVLCIATISVLRNMHSLIYLKILVSAMHVLFDIVKLGFFIFLRW